MSEVKVDTISERTAAGGVTIDGVLVKDGTATFQTAAGSPLVFEGATADAYETTFAITDPTADRTITFPDSSFTVPTSGGNTQASQWRLNTDLSVTTAETYLTANFEQPAAVDIPGTIGSALSVSASNGAWTFPATGVWYVSWRCAALAVTDNHFFTASLWVTDDDGTGWELAANSKTWIGLGAWNTIFVDYVINISDISNDKVRFSAISDTNTCTIQADTDSNECAMTFIKLGD